MNLGHKNSIRVTLFVQLCRNKNLYLYENISFIFSKHAHSKDSLNSHAPIFPPIKDIH